MKTIPVLSAALAGFVLLASLSAPLPAGAAASGPLDLVLVLETSVSMVVSDPRKLAPSAVELLIDLLPTDARVQILGFDHDVHARSEFRLLDGEGRRYLADFVRDAVASPRVGSDFKPPLEMSLQSLTTDRRDHARPIVLLLSDGITSVGDNEASSNQRQAVLRQTLPRLAAAGIRVFTIAFSEHVDTPFLQEIAESSGGLAMAAERSEQLPDLFTALFEIIEQPDMLPVGPVVQVDRHVGSLSLLLGREPGAVDNTVLISPQGESIDAQSRRPDLHWTSGHGYSLVTMDHPQPGDWRLSPSTGGSRKAYIMTDVALKVEAPDLVSAGQVSPGISAWLEQAVGGAINPPALRIRANIAALSESATPQATLELEDSDHDGRFVQNLPKLAPGAYRITVQADAGNLRRNKVRGLTVTLPDQSSDSTAGEVDKESLIALAWINMILLPIAGAGIYLYRQLRKKQRSHRK